MYDVDLSREGLQRIAKEKGKTRNVCTLIKHWDSLASYEEVIELLKGIYAAPYFILTDLLSYELEYNHMSSTVERYFLVKFLADEGLIDYDNLRSQEYRILDIGSHIGATVDAQAMFGGDDVIGTDCGRFSYDSPSGRDIAGREGVEFVEAHKRGMTRLCLVSCFHLGWVTEMSGNDFPSRLYEASMGSLVDGGNLLYTFSDKFYKSNGSLLELLPNSTIVKLPEKLNSREQYALVAKKIAEAA